MYVFWFIRYYSLLQTNHDTTSNKGKNIIFFSNNIYQWVHTNLYVHNHVFFTCNKKKACSLYLACIELLFCFWTYFRKHGINNNNNNNHNNNEVNVFKGFFSCFRLAHITPLYYYLFTISWVSFFFYFSIFF